MNISIEQIKEDALSFPKGMLHPSRTEQFKKQIGHNVINLTDIEFSDEEISLLNKGLTFSPSPKKPESHTKTS